MFFIIKSKYLPSAFTDAIHPDFKLLRELIDSSSTIDFSPLRLPRPNYASQLEIPTERIDMFNAALIHFNLDPALVIRYIQGELTASHRDIDNALSQLRPLVDLGTFSQTDYDDLARIYTLGCPNKFRIELSAAQKSAYMEYGNHSSLMANPEKIKKTMNKEERNSHLFPVSSFLCRFMSKVSNIPQAIIIKEGKNDRLVWDGSFRLRWQFLSINDLTDMEHEPTITYGVTSKNHFTWIYNLRISYPTSEILLATADVKACHRQPKLHPDIIGAFAFLIDEILYLPAGNVFGGVTSASSWEPFRRAIIALAKEKCKDPTLVDKHAAFLAIIQWDDDTIDSSITYVKAFRDRFNKGVFNDDGTRQLTESDVFVDDLLIAETRDYIKSAIAGALEAIFILLGDPDEQKRQIAVAMDKLSELVVSHVQIRLGLEVNTRTMRVTIPRSYVVEVLQIIDTKWHKSRRAVSIDEIESISGKFGHISNIGRVYRFLIAQIYSSITYILDCNKRFLQQTDSTFRAAIVDAKKTPDSATARQQISYATMVAAKGPHKVTRLKYRICPSLRLEIDLIATLLREEISSVSTPIAHLVEREPTFVSYGDASLINGGGWSIDLRFWWCIVWPDAISTRTVRCIKDNKGGNLLSINILEYLVVIIDYAASQAAIAINPPADENPTLLNRVDNTSAHSWSTKGCIQTKEGKALSRLYCFLLIDSSTNLESKWIGTKENFIADDISRLSDASNIEYDFNCLLQDYPQLKVCRRFQPSSGLLSWIWDCLTKGESPSLARVREEKLKTPEWLGTFSSVADTTSTTRVSKATAST